MADQLRRREPTKQPELEKSSRLSLPLCSRRSLTTSNHHAHRLTHTHTHSLPLLFLLSCATHLFRENTNDKPAPLRRPPSALPSDDMTPIVKCFFLPLVRANSCPKFVPVLNTGCDVCGHQSEHCASEGFEHAGVPSKYLELSLDKCTHALYTLHRLCDALRECIKCSWHRIRSACTHQEGAKWCIHTWELLGWRIPCWLHGFRLKLMYITQHLFGAKNSRSTILAVCPHFLWHNSEQFCANGLLYTFSASVTPPPSHIYTHARAHNKTV